MARVEAAVISRLRCHGHARWPWLTRDRARSCAPRSGYLAASSASAYSFVSLVQKMGPIMKPGGAALSLTYIAAEKVIPG